MKNVIKKKFILIIACFAFTAIIFQACEKSNQVPVSIASNTATSLELNPELPITEIEKTGNGILINAIHGNFPEYVDKTALKNLLMDNLPLQNAVLIQAVQEPRLSNSFVELFVVLSSPLQNNSVINQIQNHRPQMILTAINHAQNFTGDEKFYVGYSNPMTVVVGKSFTNLPVDASCGCDSKFEGDVTSRIIILSNTNTDPQEFNGACDPKKQKCGRYQGITESKDGRSSTVLFTVKCDTQFDVVCLTIN